MNQNNRFCTKFCHEQLSVDHICTFRWCDRTRWCCSECLVENIHGHLMLNKNHIMNQAQLSDKVKYDIENLKKEYLNSQQGTQIKNLLNQLVKESQELEKLIIAFRQNLESQLNNLISDDDSSKLQSLIEKVEGQNFIQLNDGDMNILLNINQYEFNWDVQSQLQDPLNKIQLQLNLLKLDVKDYQENKNNKIIDFKSRQYDIQKIYEVKNDEDYITSSLISKNEQYLVYNVKNLIHIYNLKMNKIDKSIQQKNAQSLFQFTNDSKYLFAGDCKGFVYTYNVQNGFKKFHKQRIHQNVITQIIIQKQYLITASYDKTIIKTDFINKQQIFKLVGQSNYIMNIDYDIQKNTIISTSYDQSIKVQDCLKQSIFIEYLSNYKYTQIQLINNKQDILCIDHCRDLWIFNIDYQYKKLIQNYFYHDEKEIQGFQQVNNDQNILVICDQYCKILNKEGEQINIIQHDLTFQNGYVRDYRQQLDNLNYIILQDSCQLHLLRVKHQN